MRAAIALGSNLGDRETLLRRGADALRGVLTNLTLSSTHETAYVGAGPAQPPYLNAAATGDEPDVRPGHLPSASSAATGRIPTLRARSTST